MNFNSIPNLSKINTFTIPIDKVNSILSLIFDNNGNNDNKGNNIYFFVSLISLVLFYLIIKNLNIFKKYEKYTIYILLVLLVSTIIFGIPFFKNIINNFNNTDIIIINGTNTPLDYNGTTINSNSYITTKINNNLNLISNEYTFINDNCDVATVIYDYSGGNTGNTGNGTLQLALVSINECPYCWQDGLSIQTEYKCGNTAQLCNVCLQRTIGENYKKIWYNSTNNTYNIANSGNNNIIQFNSGTKYIDNITNNTNYIYFDKYSNLIFNSKPGIFITNITTDKKITYKTISGYYSK
jgi:hypothetical protein